MLNYSGSGRVSGKFVVQAVRGSLYFLSDYISGGDLFRYFSSRKKFTEEEVRICVGEVVLAIEQLHKVCTM
jgi:serine/threonine protein kinase